MRYLRHWLQGQLCKVDHFLVGFCLFTGSDNTHHTYPLKPAVDFESLKIFSGVSPEVGVGTRITLLVEVPTSSFVQYYV